MSTSHRICETCVYCSFAGNCDRHDKPLTSIEQPACDAYEIHPLLAENAKLRELVRDMYACIGALCSMVENSPGCSMCPTNQDEERPCAAADVYCRMRELGVEV